MKKLFIISGIILLVYTFAYAGTWTITKDPSDSDPVFATQTFTGDAASESLPSALWYTHLYQIEVQGQDEAVVLTITSDMGGEFYSTTTTDAVTGEAGYPDYLWVVPPTTIMALSEVATGSTTTIRITGLER